MKKFAPLKKKTVKEILHGVSVTLKSVKKEVSKMLGVTKNESKTPNIINNLNETNRYSGTLVIVNIALNAPLIIISTTGNLLVLAAILRTPSLRSPSTVFLCSLAVSDLLVGLVVQPVYIAEQLKPSHSLLLGRRMVLFLACGVSLGTMAAISLDRFLALYYHMRYPNLMTEKSAVYASATLWVLSILLSCFGFWKGNIYFFTIAVSTTICLFISTFSYVRIYFLVRQHRLQIQVQQQAVENLNVEHKVKMERRKKSAMNTFIYYIFMLLCYSPALFSALNLAIFPSRWTTAWLLADTVAFTNSAINPFLYCWRTREIRAAVFKTIRNILYKRTEEN